MASPDYSASQNASSGVGESDNVALSKLVAQRTGVNRSKKMVAGDHHYPSAATAAVCTYTAVSGQYHVLRGVSFSYDTDPTGGNLKIEDVSGTTVYSVDVGAKGVYTVVFPIPLRSAVVNTALIVTLASGAGSVVGKLNCLGHTVEA